MRFFSSSSRTCLVCSSMVPLKCAPTPARKSRLPYETALENNGASAGAVSDLGLAGYDFFSNLPDACASAVLPSTIPPVATAAALAAFLRRPLLDCCSMDLLLLGVD